MAYRPVDELEIKAILQNEIYLALGSDGGKLSQDRRRLLEAYQGFPDGHETPGQSQIVSRNILEAIEWALPALLRLFYQGDKLVEFEPYRPGEENLADQATEYINFILNEDNRGFLILHDWFKTALLQKVGYLKVEYVTERTWHTDTYTGLTDEQFKMLTEPEDVDVIEDKEYDNPDPMNQFYTMDDPAPGHQQLHDCKLRVWETEGRVRIHHVVPEEMLISRRANNAVLDGKYFVCHRARKTVSDLREMGFDEDKIQEAIMFEDPEWMTERIARFELEEDWPLISDDNVIDESRKVVWVEESYLPCDMDSDGISELRKIVSAGQGAVVFSNELIDDTPFVAICPVPMPGKFYGLGLADLVYDLQQIKTAILRGVLNNIYLTNAPRMVVAESAATDETMDDLLNVRPGGIVRVAVPDGIQPITIPFVAGQSMPVLDYIDQAQEARTGIARHNQGLDPDDLNKTATGVNLIQRAAAQRLELIGRIFAETGIKPLAKKILGLVVKHQEQGRMISLNGQWFNFDPRQWNQNFVVKANVGLGTGNRDQNLQHLQMLAQAQQMIVQAQGGPTGPIVTPQNIYDLAIKINKNTGFQEEFFTNPSQAGQNGQGMGQQHQNPEMMKMQAQVQIQQQKGQTELQLMQRKAELQGQMAAQEHQQKLQQMQAQHQAEMQMEQEREQFKAAIEMEREKRQAARDMAQMAREAAAPVGTA